MAEIVCYHGRPMRRKLIFPHSQPPLRLAGSILLLASSLLLARPLQAQESCVTAQCHATLLKGTSVHPPTETCDTCHEAVQSPHPQKGRKTFKLTKERPALCYDCHDPFGKKRQVHPPVQAGDCGTCHDPHAAGQPKLLLQPLKDLCVNCHEDPAAAAHVHGPVSAGDCTACHSPHESDARPLLLKEGEALCFGCHVDIQETVKKKHLHPALTGGCVSCHDPHGSAHPKLLSEAGAKLCFQCHGDIEEKVAAPVVHRPIRDAKGCASCHSPHASDAEKLLSGPEKETCLGCHPGVVTKVMTTLHGPIAEGKCTPCHDPHGSRNPKLLVKEFPGEPYAPYSENEYELCFSCHKRDLLQYPDTSFATKFRDGERNLHYLHVNDRRKGRACTLCHVVHGGASPLIAESVPFGKWKLPLKYLKTDSGGSCAPGCHRPQAYDRQNPGKKPPSPARAPAPPKE